MNSSIDVFIATWDRPLLLKNCCESLMKALPPRGCVYLVVNGEDQASIGYLETLSDPRFHWSVHPKVSRSFIRNKAFEVSRAPLICFLDDDVEVPPEFFEVALSRFESDPSLSVLGGPNLTPPKSSGLESLFGAALTSAFAAPKVRARYGGGVQGERPATEYDLTLCNLVVRHEHVKGLEFPYPMASNEETLFLHRCRKRKLKLVFSSSLSVFHQRRSSLRAFAEQIFTYGKGRGEQSFLEPLSCHPFCLIPSLSISFGLSLIVLSPALLAWLFFLYGAAALLSGIVSPAIRHQGFIGVFLTLPLCLLIHTSYGFGVVYGWLGRVLAQCRNFLSASETIPTHQPVHIQ